MPASPGARDPQPDADGWINWYGGECPVSDETIIEVKFKSGVAGSGEGFAYCWDHRDTPSDIASYRIFKNNRVNIDDMTVDEIIYYLAMRTKV